MRPEKIHTARLREELEEFSNIGRVPGKEGLYRRAFTAEEEAARDWLQKKIQEANLALHTDGARNLCSRLGNGNRPAIITGSHIDSVPGGGPLDGALGVLCGLECLRRLQECQIPLTSPVELIAFTDEEARFGSMLGSKAICGQHTLAGLHRTTDETGYRLEDALQEYGSSCEAVMDSRRSAEEVKAFIELHIEQGPVLDHEHTSIGIVSDIVGLFRWRATLTGQANHSGTTPMHMRRDALSGFAEFAAGIERTLQEHGSPPSRATIGKVETKPGAIATIPGEVHFLFDVRDIDAKRLAHLKEIFERQISDIAQKRNLELRIETIGEVPPTPCDQRLTDCIASVTKELALSYRYLPSGAAHDAVTMSSLAPVAMIFIPSVGGISHSPLECTNWQDIENGANVLLNTLAELGHTS